jgi:hypothetical protein
MKTRTPPGPASSQNIAYSDHFQNRQAANFRIERRSINELDVYLDDMKLCNF